MADMADRAQERLEREEHWRQKYAAPYAAPMACGACLHCGEPLPPGRRWCDADCRDDWTRR